MKCNFIPILLSVSLLLCGCGGSSSGKSDMTAIIDGSEIALYMSRDEVESILGDSYSPGSLIPCDYGSFSLGYTDDVLTAIVFNDDSVSTGSGLAIGCDDISSYGFAETVSGKMYYLCYSYSDGKFTPIDDSIQDASVGDGAWLDITLDNNGTVNRIDMMDFHTAKYCDFDE